MLKLSVSLSLMPQDTPVSKIKGECDISLTGIIPGFELISKTKPPRARLVSLTKAKLGKLKKANDINTALLKAKLIAYA